MKIRQRRTDPQDRNGTFRLTLTDLSDSEDTEVELIFR
jgi:hypothetical protein